MGQKMLIDEDEHQQRDKVDQRRDRTRHRNLMLQKKEMQKKDGKKC